MSKYRCLALIVGWLPVVGSPATAAELTLDQLIERRGIDGMVLDTQGNIYATAEEGGKTGLYVFSPAGKQLGFIRTPETATNCTFGDKDLKTLYITAGGSVYKARLNATGFLPYPRPKP